MDNAALEEYADRVPFLAKAGIKALADDASLGIAVALMEDGNMTFSELEAKFGMDPDALRRHLAALQNGDLVRNYCEKRDGRPYFYYEATDVPHMLLDAVYVSLRKKAKERNAPAGPPPAGKPAPAAGARLSQM